MDQPESLQISEKQLDALTQVAQKRHGVFFPLVVRGNPLMQIEEGFAIHSLRTPGK